MGLGVSVFWMVAPCRLRSLGVSVFCIDKSGTSNGRSRRDKERVPRGSRRAKPRSRFGRLGCPLFCMTRGPTTRRWTSDRNSGGLVVCILQGSGAGTLPGRGRTNRRPRDTPSTSHSVPGKTGPISKFTTHDFLKHFSILSKQ